MLDGVGRHQQVLVVKQADFGHLQNKEVENLDEEHEEELPDAADLQEDGGGQQAQQNAEGEVLKEDRQSKCRRVKIPGPPAADLLPNLTAVLGVPPGSCRRSRRLRRRLRPGCS